MRFDTAIFYDLENILKGYNFSHSWISNLSLREIIEQIKQTDMIGEIAVQRAYANWSDSRLNVMKEEINELGIEPVQVFGFSRFQKKNAADIQLAVEAMDLAYIRPAIKKFVIVSGDGGFAALAKKLHECGKIVIGCAYDEATNHVFRSLCDAFVGIIPPQEDEELVTGIDENLNVTNPKVLRLAKTIDRLEIKNTEELITQGKKIISWFERDAQCLKELKDKGIYLSVVKEAFKYGIVNFESKTTKIGLNKFIEFLQYICQDTNLCVFNRSSEAKIGWRNASIPGFTSLPDLEAREVHSLDNYRSILASSKPCFKIPSASQELRSVADWIPKIALTPSSLDELIAAIESQLNGSLSNESIKLALHSFISADIFQREPDHLKLSEQTLTLKEEFSSSESILYTLKQAASSKIASCLEEVNNDIIDEIIPS